jgi:hypothetical protein
MVRFCFSLSLLKIDFDCTLQQGTNHSFHSAAAFTLFDLSFFNQPGHLFTHTHTHTSKLFFYSLADALLHSLSYPVSSPRTSLTLFPTLSSIVNHLTHSLQFQISSICSPTLFTYSPPLTLLRLCSHDWYDVGTPPDLTTRCSRATAGSTSTDRPCARCPSSSQSTTTQWVATR